MSFALGPLLGFIVYEMLENTAVKEVHRKINALQLRLDTAAAQLKRDIKIIGMLHSIDSNINNLIAQEEHSISLLEKIAGILGSISNQMNNLKETFLQELKNTDTDELIIELANDAAFLDGDS